MGDVVVVDPFFRKLYIKLTEELEGRIYSLAEGSAVTHGAQGLVDAFNTAMKYRADISYIQALKQVIELGLELDREQYGVRTKDNEYGDE